MVAASSLSLFAHIPPEIIEDILMRTGGAWWVAEAEGFVSVASVCRSWRDVAWASSSITVEAFVQAAECRRYEEYHQHIQYQSSLDDEQPRIEALLRMARRALNAANANANANGWGSAATTPSLVRKVAEGFSVCPTEWFPEVFFSAALHKRLPAVMRCLIEVFPERLELIDNETFTDTVGWIDTSVNADNDDIFEALQIMLECPIWKAYDKERVLVDAAEWGNVELTRLLLMQPDCAPRADCLLGWAFFEAAGGGHVEVCRLLLGWPEHAPRADCEDGCALFTAAMHGHVDVCRLLLEWPEHAPRADCDDGSAFFVAATTGRVDVCRLLLEWPEHAPRAACGDGKALIGAAVGGHVDVCRLLLEWPEHVDVCRLLLEWPEHIDVSRLLLDRLEHPPRADCRDGEALVAAAAEGRVDVCRLLLGWPEHAPRADCREGEALVAAARCGQVDVCRLLLEWPEHAPRADGAALVEAGGRGYVDVCRVLLEGRFGIL